MWVLHLSLTCENLQLGRVTLSAQESFEVTTSLRRTPCACITPRSFAKSPLKLLVVGIVGFGFKPKPFAKREVEFFGFVYPLTKGFCWVPRVMVCAPWQFVMLSKGLALLQLGFS